MKLKNMNKLAQFIVFSSVVFGVILFTSIAAHAAVDTDSDGYPDYIEVQNHYDPYSPCGKEVYTAKAYAYGKGRLLDLIDESCRQSYMVRTVNAILGKNITTNAKDLNTLTNAFIYGNYTPTEIAALIATNQPLVHPTIKRDAWSRSPQYVKALQNKQVQEIMNRTKPSVVAETPLYFPSKNYTAPQTTQNLLKQNKPIDSIANLKVVDYQKNPLMGVTIVVQSITDDVFTLQNNTITTDIDGMAYLRGSIQDYSSQANITLSHPTFTTVNKAVRLQNNITGNEEIVMLYARPSELPSTKQNQFDNSIIITKPVYSIVESGKISEVEIIVTDKSTGKSLNGYRVYVAGNMYKDDLNKVIINNLVTGHYVAKIVKVNNATQQNQIVEYFTLTVIQGKVTHITFDVDSSLNVKVW